MWSRTETTCARAQPRAFPPMQFTAAHTELARGQGSDDELVLLSYVSKGKLPVGVLSRAGLTSDIVEWSQTGALVISCSAVSNVCNIWPSGLQKSAVTAVVMPHNTRHEVLNHHADISRQEPTPSLPACLSKSVNQHLERVPTSDMDDPFHNGFHRLISLMSHLHKDNKVRLPHGCLLPEMGWLSNQA